MHFRLKFWALVCFALFLNACSGPGAGRSDSSSLRFHLGTSARDHIISTSEDALLTRYGYRLDLDVDTAEDIRLETSWKDVVLLTDEKNAGYREVRLRIRLNARPRSRAGGIANTFTTRMMVECEARTSIGGDWTAVSITPEREDYFREIADYLENEFKAGVM